MARVAGSEQDATSRLVQWGYLSENQGRELADRADLWAASEIDLVLAGGLAPGKAVARALAETAGLPLIARRALPFDESFARRDELSLFVKERCLPWCGDNDGTIVFAVVNPYTAQSAIRDTLGPEIPFRMALATKAELTSAMLSAFGAEIAREATSDLSYNFPDQSARGGMPLHQGVWLALITAAIVGGFLYAPHVSFVAASLLSGVFFLLVMGFRLLLIAASFGIARNGSAARAQKVIAPGAHPPVYSLLIPLRDEADLLPYTVQALKSLDYPDHLLDILLILEEDDELTRAAADELALDDRFTRVIVPSGRPRTKPKACNFALAFARGDHICVFDAEDRPAADELALALSSFSAHPDASCLQARLTFFNVSENWLTRQFAIEFATWFDFMLPGLERLDLPIPLGGSSNHFRRGVLGSIHGWDAFNMTEDADAGIRLARSGGRTRTLASTTVEEGNCELMNWLHQRSRWLKGYMMTYLVHMRRPGALWRELGPAGFVSFQLLIGGAIASALLHLVFWGILIIHLGRTPFAGAGLWSRFLISWTVCVLIAGNGIAIGTGLLALARPQFKGQGRFILALNALSMPLYWFLISIAAIKALISLVGRPFYWAKTRHGISRLNHNKAGSSRHTPRRGTSHSRSRQA